MPRQDAYRLGRDSEGQRLVVAVADGISSSPYSELGASVAAEATVAAVRDRLRRGLDFVDLQVEDIFSDVAVRMVDVARARNIDPHQTCTVLMTAVIEAGREARHSRRVWVGWLGDSSAWRLTDGQWTLLAGDDKLEHDGMTSNAVNACLPLNAHQAREHSFYVVPGDVIAFVTDGIGDALSRIPAANRYFADSWVRPPAVTSFLNDVCYEAKGFQDDRTAVVVWIGPHEAEPGHLSR